jgi:hypothetical protein
MNDGKIFERQIKLSAENQGILICRLNDTDLSWMKNRETRFTAQNPCDFIMYQYPNIFFLELKSTIYNSISIQTDEKGSGMIKLHQINSLVHMGQYDGSNAGFILNFHQKDSVEETTYYLSIQDFSNFLAENDKKSINKLDIINYGGIILDQTLKRTRYMYNIQKMIEDIRKSQN